MGKLRLLFALVVVVPAAAVAIGADEGEGKKLYDSKCAMCHGKNGVTKKMAEPSANLNDPEWQKGTSMEKIVKLTAEGKGKMKGFEGKLTDKQMELIAEYILTLKQETKE